MNPILRGLCVATLSFPLLAAAAELPSRRFQLPIDPGAQALQTPVLNAEKALAEDAIADKGAPLRYAIMHKASVNLAERSKFMVGRWTEVDAGFELWRTRIDAPGALSIDLALKPFQLPEGAEVWLSDASGQRVRGPYTAADNPKSGEFWTPYVPGDVAFLEVLVPKARRDELRLGIMSVQQAYRSIESGVSPFAKSGSCNVDVACPQGNDYRDQINAVARYSVSGGLCTGQLVNNTAQDNKRYFMTANHCVSTQSAADSVVLYWKYENPTCRTPGSSESGVPISTVNNSITQTGGAMLRATHEPSDTTLLEVNTEVPVAANAFWLGWDRGTTVPSSAVGIHHPSGDEKRISFENNPLDSTDIDPPGVPGSKHWHVPGWDLGTTEQGSSGSVLMNPQKRLIGVLSGGAASCSFNFDDYYGRLNVAWDGGGTAASRVKDWLDPGASGATAIDGKAGCDKPVLSLSLPASAVAGTATPITLQISGGTAPYTVAWDLDNNLVVDRTSSGVNGSATIQPSFPSPANTRVSVGVTDALGCAATAEADLVVAGPILSGATNGSPVQACGDGDSRFEPGEIWNFPVRLRNVGSGPMNDGFAIVVGGAVPGLAGGSGARSDDFGYQVLSSRESGLCRYQAIDMSAAAALTPTVGAHVSNAGANDEGYVAGLSVGGSAPFRFYGSDVTSLMMSTNGYLSTNPADSGDDYTPVCGVDEHADVVDGRIQALHDDLVIQSGGSLRHRHFDSCPRPSDVGSTTQGCTVFEWRNMGQYSTGGSAVGNAVFQTVLYDQSYEIVHQYITAVPDNGASAIIGQQSPDESIRFDYQCTASNAAPSGSAVCFFHPSALPSGSANAPVHVLNPAIGVGNLAAGAQSDVTVAAYIDPAASCGDAISVNLLGGVDDVSSYVSEPAKIHGGNLAEAGSCQVATQCAAQLPSLPALPPGGVYLNPTRSGNGQNIFNIGSVLSSVWFTGNTDRTPVWYLMAGPWSPNFALAKTELRKFTRTSSSPFTVSSTPVGTSWFARGDDDAAYVNVWQLDGIWGGEKLVRFYDTANLPNPNHTGGWRNAGESGWGVVIDEHALQGQASTGMLTYLYDAQNQPRWTLGEQFNSSNTIAHSVFQVHCPSCPRFPDFGSTAQSVGNVTRSYQSQTVGTLDSTLTLPAPLGGTWNRVALPIQMITPPLSPSP